jgi:hypothetical protein
MVPTRSKDTTSPARTHQPDKHAIHVNLPDRSSARKGFACIEHGTSLPAARIQLTYPNVRAYLLHISASVTRLSSRDAESRTELGSDREGPFGR